MKFPIKSYAKEKINLNFYFHISLWCFQRFYEGNTKKCENKNNFYFKITLFNAQGGKG